MSDLQKRIADLSPEKRALLMQRLRQKHADQAQAEAIQPRADQSSHPLSFAQQRMWFLDQMDAGSSLYTIPAALRLRGPLDNGALERSLEAMVRRHETLRAHFPTERGRPVQVIAPADATAATPRLAVVDLSYMPAGERETAALSLAAADAREPFNLASGPLLRARLVRLGATDHLLLLTLHHIIADGWSIGVLTRELAALYTAFSTGAPSPLPPLAIQYADYAAWQHQHLQGELLETQISYWKQQLDGIPPLELPTDRPRPAVQGYVGAHYGWDLPDTLVAPLDALAHQEHATRFMTLLAAFATLLHRYSGQDDFGIGAPIAGRTRPELEPLIGFFVNSLVLRVQLDGTPSFRDLLRQVRATSLDAFAHQELPFETLIDAVQAERDLSRTPLFQVMFTLQSMPTGALQLPGISLELLDVETGTAKFDLLLLVTEDEHRLHASFEYNTDLFDASTIARMAQHFNRLLAAALAEPDCPLELLPMLSDAELRQVLVEWNTTATDYPRDATIATLFEAQAAHRPDAVAVIFRDQQLTYGELNNRANQLAHRLQQLGVGADTLVGLALERSLDLVVATLATLKAGGAYLPIDPNYPRERVQLMLEDARPGVLITQASHDDWTMAIGEHDPALAAYLASLPRIDLSRDWPMIAREPTTNPAHAAHAENLAYVMYTSGSTGLPKGIAVTQRNVVRLVKHTNYATLDEHVVFLQFGAVSFDAATLEIWGPLLNGGRVVLFPDSAPDLEQLGQTIRSHGVTTMFLTSGMFHQMVDYRLQDLSGLRELMAGGDVISLAHARRVVQELPNCRFSNVYGPTENTTYTTYFPFTDPERVGASLPIGRPIANTTVFILDRQMQPVPVGVPGELYTGGDGVARGYLNRPELTAERFVDLQRVRGWEMLVHAPGVPIAQPRLYRTGDRVRWLPDGTIEFLGRIDQQVKIRGFRIEPGEIEATIRQHPGVREVAVIVREDQPGVKKLVAYVVVAGDAGPAPGDGQQPPLATVLREFLRARLPEFMVPAAFVALPALPLNANGKLDRRALPAPDQVRDTADERYVAPRSGIERFLAEIWQDVLGIERISIHDNFFELGGDSLQAAVVTNRIQEDLQVSAHVRALFMAPNIADLARYIEEYYPEVARKLGDEPASTIAAPTAIVSSGMQAGQVNEARISQIRAIIPPLPPRPAGQVPAARNPRAIFILSPPRSGSTLLRTMLAGHSQLFAPPELDLLSFNTLAERRAAFSGDHSFWLEGTIRALMEIMDIDADQAARTMAGFEEAGMTVKEFYSQMQTLLGARRLVDKTPVYALDPAILQRMEADFDQPQYVHLVRHPLASIYSFIEARLDHVFFRYPHPFTQRELAELVWIISHQHILSFLRGIPAERQHRLNFEDLVGQPDVEMQRLCDFLGIPFEPAMLTPYEGRRMTDGIRPDAQMVGDFKFYLRTTIDPRAANRWQQFHTDDFLSPISWQLGAELGYPPVTTPAATPATNDLPPLQPVPRDQELPLSFAQQRLWFLDQLDPGSPLYNIPAAVRLQGPLDAAVLTRSIQEIVRRHEVLRTTFTTVEGRAVQVINPASDGLTLRRLDLRHLASSAERLAEAHRLSAEDAQQPFDLGRGPLMRASLLQIDDDDHIVLLTMHHIIADGWSTNVIVRELGTLYQAFLHGQPSPLPDLRVQYADVAVWQRMWHTSHAMADQLRYWKQQLGGADGRNLPAPLELPTDRPRPAIQRSRGQRLSFELPVDLSEQIRTLCRREGTTLFMTMLAAFTVLMHRYSGQDDISVGTPIANRTRAEFEPLIGFFVNTLVLRNDLSGDPGFRELLQRVRQTAVEAYAHQDLPFEMLVNELQPQRSLNQTPLFQVMFTVQSATYQALKLPSLTIVPLEVDSLTSKFDLTLSVVDRAAGLRGSIEYNCDLFDASTIERMVGHYRTLLEGAVAHPDMPVSRLPILTAAERGQILGTWNQTAAPYPHDQTIHALFTAQAARTPETIAVACGHDQLSFHDLDTRANQLAHHLQSLGVGPDTLVGISLDRSVELIVAILATLKAGGAYLPLDPSYPADRLRYMVAHAQPRVLITRRPANGAWWVTPGTAGADHLAAGRPATVSIDAEWPVIAARYPASAPASAAGPAHLAYVIYTSGSTGQPKGVMIEHRQVLNLAAGLKRTIYDRLPGEQLRISLNAPISFDASVQQIVMLIYGHTLDIIPQDVRLDSSELLAFVRNRRLDLLDCVPSQLKLLLDAGMLDGTGPAPRLVLPGGEAIDDDTWRRLAAAPATDFFNVYGPTECTVDSTTIAAREAPERATIGRPLPNVQVCILDRHMQPVPVGVPGEIFIGGAGVGRGYLNRPDLTAERFVEDIASDPGIPSTRWYRSGDLGRYRPDGTIEFLGRLDNQVKIRGFRIELGEIEAALRQHEAVREAVVTVREDTPGAKRLVAYVVAGDGGLKDRTTVDDSSVPMAGGDGGDKDRTTAADSSSPGSHGPSGPQSSVPELRAYLKERLPEYMVPAAFVVLDAWPLTPNGKIDRRALPAPDSTRSALDAQYAAPSNAAEQTLAEIWSAVLRVERVGVHDNFFELGGDSILSIQVISRANAAGLRLTPRQLFQYPTIAGLAAVAGTATTVVAEQGPVTGPAPLTPIQRWFFDQAFADPHHWNQALLLTVHQPLDHRLVVQTVARLLEHHDALRLRFHHRASGWSQEFAVTMEDAAAGLVEWADLSGLPAAEQAAAITARSAAVQGSLDLAHGPLMRLVAFDLGAGHPGRLLLVIHHLVIDGVSWRVLLEDFQTVYRQLQAGLPAHLPARTTSYGTWAERLVAYAGATEALAEQAYWQAITAHPGPQLPRDMPGGDNSGAVMRSVRTSLDEVTTRALLQDVPAAYGTEIVDALLTALARALCHWTGGDTALLTLEGHGREQLFDDVDLSRTVGWFTSMFPVRLSLAGADDPGTALRAVKEQLRAIPRRGIGYGVLRYLADDAVAAALRPAAEPQVSFNYLGQLDAGLGSTTLFGAAPEEIGPSQSLRAQRPALLDISSSILGGRLVLEWRYSAMIHHAGTIERLAQQFDAALRALIAHCQTPGAVGYTPSDFPDVDLSQAELDALLEEVGGDSID